MLKVPSSENKPRKPKLGKLIHNVPNGYSWGWGSEPIPPFTLETVDARHRGKHRIVLETKGRRCFKSDKEIPRDVLSVVRREVTKHRLWIEAAYITLLLQAGQIRLIRRLPSLEIVVYPGWDEEFRVIYDLSKDWIPEYIADLRSEDVVLREDMCALELFPERPQTERQHYFLPTLIYGRLRGYHIPVDRPGWRFNEPSNL